MPLALKEFVDEEEGLHPAGYYSRDVEGCRP